MSVSGDGAGNVQVTFNQAQAAAGVDPTQLMIDIDNGDLGSAFQVSPAVVGLTCGSSTPGMSWSTSGTFVAGLAPDAGLVV